MDGEVFQDETGNFIRPEKVQRRFLNGTPRDQSVCERKSMREARQRFPIGSIVEIPPPLNNLCIGDVIRDDDGKRLGTVIVRRQNGNVRVCIDDDSPNVPPNMEYRTLTSDEHIHALDAGHAAFFADAMDQAGESMGVPAIFMAADNTGANYASALQPTLTVAQVFRDLHCASDGPIPCTCPTASLMTAGCTCGAMKETNP
jgi:hypothetical protein